MSKNLRVFIVEDEALILMQIEMMLEDAGHIVVGSAVSANEAIILIQKIRPELVLIDLQLADKTSGLDVAQAVRQFSGMKMAFVTANARQLTDEMEGAMAVIAKPFTGSAFEEAMVYLEHCIHRPPPNEIVPLGLRVAPNYLAAFAGMRI